MPEPAIRETFKTPFQEQLDYFRGKGNLPTERWDDILGAAHDRAFIVAGAAKADLLNDLRQAVDKAIAQGTGLEAFRKDFAKIIQRTGWDYTGSFDWRTRVIYQTNLATSYAAGRWAQLNDPDLVKARPYWKYVHSDGVANPRPLHVAWSGLILARTDPWWRTHFPPNGWGCHCRVVAVSKREYDAASPDKTQAPDDQTIVHTDRDGIEHVIPRGIDYGFAHAPGASLQELSKTIGTKVRDLPLQLGDALAEDLAKALRFEAQVTTKEAEAWARRHSLADHVDYTGVKPEVANAWNHSLFDHLQEFPELRANQQFVGTAQAQFERAAKLERARMAERLMAMGVSEETAVKQAQRSIKKKIVPGNRYAQSWRQPGVSGVSVNKKFGADPEMFRALLEKDVRSQWHPPGCETIRSVVDHEFGHQLDALLALRTDDAIISQWKQSLAKGLKQEVSEYAGENIAEFIAECWAEACNATEPRPVARAIAGIVRTRYRSRFGSPGA